MKKEKDREVFIYWDNSNIFHEAQRFADKRKPGSDVRHRLRIDFEKIYRLAHADRKVAGAYAAGSVPPDTKELWKQMEKNHIEVEKIDRFLRRHSEQDLPDRILQLRMLEDAMDHQNPGIAVLLSGDGKGHKDDRGFLGALKRMHNQGWQVEVLSWKHACSRKMKEWVEEFGVFVALDKFFEEITFVKKVADSRESADLDLSKRPVSKRPA